MRLVSSRSCSSSVRGSALPLALSCVFAHAVARAADVTPTSDAPLWTEPDARSGAQPRTVALPSLAPLVDAVSPAVLVVFTEGGGEDDPMSLPFSGGDEGDERPEAHGEGAGFLISKTGYALTNHHVIENATRIEVSVGGARERIGARVVGSDEKTDVALLQLLGGRKDWPVIVLGSSDALRPGDFVVAIGNPFGLEQSASLGILSARGRRDIAPSGRAGLYDFLQTDASINPGNSGGPLLNLAGHAVGINAATNVVGNGIGFAIPIAMVKRMLPQLRDEGRVKRSWVGVGVQALEPAVARALGLKDARGALVREVIEEGPGGVAGILPGDVIVSFGGRALDTADELPLVAGEHAAGERVKVDVVRDGRARTLTLVLGAHPDNVEARATDKGASAGAERAHVLGLSVTTLDADDRARLGLPSELSGARVTRVKRGSAAFAAGLQVDDVIFGDGATAVASSKAFSDRVVALPAGGVLKLRVRRGATTLFVPVQKP